jgi:predicted ribosomally synthesized peptide with SipW-like signal peptide
MSNNGNSPSRRRLVALGLTAAAVISVSGAMSLALFTDDAAVDSNAFTTGTIVLSASPTSALFNVSAMMPGDADYGQLTVSNTGTGDLRYSMTASATDPDSKALADAVSVVIREKATGSCSADFTGTVVLASTALSSAAFGDATPGQDTGDRSLSAGTGEDLCFQVSLPIGTGNSYQGATTTATFTFQAEQTANNP